MLCLLDGGPPKHSTALFSPAGLTGDLPECLSQLWLVPFTEGNRLPPFICQNCQVKVESIESKLHKLCELAIKTASASSMYKEATIPRTVLV